MRLMIRVFPENDELAKSINARLVRREITVHGPTGSYQRMAWVLPEDANAKNPSRMAQFDLFDDKAYPARKLEDDETAANGSKFDMDGKTYSVKVDDPKSDKEKTTVYLGDEKVYEAEGMFAVEGLKHRIREAKANEPGFGFIAGKKYRHKKDGWEGEYMGTGTIDALSGVNGDSDKIKHVLVDAHRMNVTKPHPNKNGPMGYVGEWTGKFKPEDFEEVSTPKAKSVEEHKGKDVDEIDSIEDKGNGTRAVLMKYNTGSNKGMYGIRLEDTDAGETVPTIEFFKDEAKARQRFEKFKPAENQKRAALIDPKLKAKVEAHNSKQHYEGKTAEDLLVSNTSHRIERIETNHMDEYNRRYYNSMTSAKEQDKYMARLAEKKIESRLYTSERNFFEIPNYVYDYLAQKYPDRVKAETENPIRKSILYIFKNGLSKAFGRG